MPTGSLRSSRVELRAPENREISADEQKRINDYLTKYDLTIIRGGRFYHFSSSSVNKGDAVKRILNYYSDKLKVEMINSIAVGDSENDISMLKAVDSPFLVKRIDNKTIIVDFEVNKTGNIGPAGFTEAIESIFL